MREAGERTTWTDPDEAYEAAVHAAVDAASTTDERCARVLDDLVDEARRRRAAATRWPPSCSR